MHHKRDAADLAVDEAFREADRMKREAKRGERDTRMDHHAERARAKMIDLARTANPHWDFSGLFRHNFTKRQVLNMAECLPHEWQDLLDAFDRMTDIGLGNGGRDWFLGDPSVKADRRSHMVSVGSGAIRRAGQQAETDNQAGHTAAVIEGMAKSKDKDAFRRLPATLKALGHPMDEAVAQKLLGTAAENDNPGADPGPP